MDLLSYLVFFSVTAGIFGIARWGSTSNGASPAS
jgi:hypothetical protein